MRSLDSEQVSYARDCVVRLWPAPARVRSTRRRAPVDSERLVAEWLLLPNPSRPTLLVPTRLARASQMLQRHGDRLWPRTGRAALAWGIRTGVLRQLPTSRIQVTHAADTAMDQASSAVGSLAASIPGVRECGLILGTPRPNRKPVLQLFSVDGSTLAFVKVGLSDYTRELVKTEAANLAIIQKARLRTLEAPQVMHLGPFDGLSLLALSPLKSSQLRRNATIPWAAMRELALLSVVRGRSLQTSTYWQRLTQSVVAAGMRPGASDCARLMQRVSERWGDSLVDFGGWHGDWAPWNMGYRDGVVELWDWERYSADVPLGFDAIHYQAQLVRHGRDDTSAREAWLVDRVPDTLERMDAPAATREPTLILVLYLLEIAVRFAGMAGHTENAAIHPRARWALEFASRLMS